jgi:hypothetical protein
MKSDMEKRTMQKKRHEFDHVVIFNSVTICLPIQTKFRPFWIFNNLKQ